MPQWLQYVLVILGSGGIGGLLFNKIPDWFRFKKKDVVDVKDKEQDIVSKQMADSRGINETAIEVNAIMLASLKQTDEKLKRVEEALVHKELTLKSLQGLLTEEREENVRLKGTVEELKEEIGNLKTQTGELFNGLTECLKIDNCEEALKTLKNKFGIK